MEMAMSTSGGRPAAGGATRASSCSRLAPPPSACAAPTAESDTPARPSAAPPNPPVGHTLVTAESLVSETPGLTHTRLRSPRLRASRRLGSSTLARSWLPQQPHRQRQGASAGSTCSAGLVARAALRRYSCCAATKPAHSPRKKTRYRRAVLRIMHRLQSMSVQHMIEVGAFLHLPEHIRPDKPALGSLVLTRRKRGARAARWPRDQHLLRASAGLLCFACESHPASPASAPLGPGLPLPLPPARIGAHIAPARGAPQPLCAPCSCASGGSLTLELPVQQPACLPSVPIQTALMQCWARINSAQVQTTWESKLVLLILPPLSSLYFL